MTKFTTSRTTTDVSRKALHHGINHSKNNFVAHTSTLQIGTQENNNTGMGKIILT
jgi:hypothetical protein